jgi:hypothetical protein
VFDFQLQRRGDHALWLGVVGVPGPGRFHGGPAEAGRHGTAHRRLSGL